MTRATINRLECLDGLRGVLAVYVMISHLAPFAALPAWVQHVLSHGGAAVDMFFILSGLVILRSLESLDFAATPFLIGRITRIFPVFLAMFAVAVAVQPLPANFDALPWIAPDSLARGIWSDGWPRSWGFDIAAHLTMTHGLFPNGVASDVWLSFLGAAWSLSTEWQFYVLVLLLGRMGLDPPRLAAFFLSLAVVGLVWDSTVPEAWRFSRAFLPNKADYFALGIASAIWLRGESVRPLIVVLLATLLLCAARGQAGKLLPPVLWVVCLLAEQSYGPLKPVSACLRWPVARWLGAISYPIYLANEPLQKILGYGLTLLVPGDPFYFTLFWLPAATLIPIAAAAVVHRYIELPGLRWGRARMSDVRCSGENEQVAIIRS